MNENINISEILKDAPKGTKLWSIIHGPIKLKEVIGDIICQTDRLNNNTVLHFDEEGHWNYETDGQRCYFSESVVLFPSRNYLGWKDFKVPWMHKNFELGQKILVPYSNGTIYKWRLTFYSHYDESSKHHMTTDAMCFPDEEVIAYKGNENKLGKPVNE